MKRFTLLLALTLFIHLYTQAQCSCYKIIQTGIDSPGNLSLELSNDCDNSVYLNFYVVSSIAPFDTLASREYWDGDVNMGDSATFLLSTALTSAPDFGTYKVGITNNSLICDSLAFSADLTSIDDIAQNDFDIYPNPTQGTFTIDLSGFDSPGLLNICNEAGQIIQSRDFTNESSINLELDAPAGIYYIVIGSGSQRIIQKLLKN